MKQYTLEEIQSHVNRVYLTCDDDGERAMHFILPRKVERKEGRRNTYFAADFPFTKSPSPCIAEFNLDDPNQYPWPDKGECIEYVFMTKEQIGHTIDHGTLERDLRGLVNEYGGDGCNKPSHIIIRRLKEIINNQYRNR